LAPTYLLFIFSVGASARDLLPCFLLNHVCLSKQQEEIAVLKEKERLDLCCICENGVECVDCGTSAKPKLHCELFEIAVQSLPFREESQSFSEEIKPSVVAPVGGLCCNCMNRPNCTIQAPEGDIWHCEEYC
jgi:hypothetical protein